MYVREASTFSCVLACHVQQHKYSTVEGYEGIPQKAWKCVICMSTPTLQDLTRKIDISSFQVGVNEYSGSTASLVWQCAQVNTNWSFPFRAIKGMCIVE